MVMLNHMVAMTAVTAHQLIDQLAIAIACIVTMYHNITTHGVVNIVQSTHIRDAAAKFHSTIKSAAAECAHNTIIRHAAECAHNTTQYANANGVQSMFATNIADGAHNTTISTQIAAKLADALKVDVV